MVFVVAAKDLRLEYRTRQALLTTLFFAVLILIVFNFAFDPGDPAVRAAIPGILWVSLLFPGVIQLNRSFQSEREDGTLLGLILSPVDRGLLFLGKYLANWVLLLLVDFLVLGAFLVFYNVALSWSVLGFLLLLMALVGGVFSAVGTLFAAMVSSLRGRDVLLPVLLFPILVPEVIAAVNATRELFGSANLEHLGSWIRLLIVANVVFGAVAFLIFDYVVED
ncbi:MAG: heme exporter protein CcmB [Acidobacteriota bacterium]